MSVLLMVLLSVGVLLRCSVRFMTDPRADYASRECGVPTFLGHRLRTCRALSTRKSTLPPLHHLQASGFRPAPARHVAGPAFHACCRAGVRACRDVATAVNPCDFLRDGEPPGQRPAEMASLSAQASLAASPMVGHPHFAPRTPWLSLRDEVIEQPHAAVV